MREDIIKWAQEAGIYVTRPDEFQNICIDDLERFAALVRADEREACAKVCERMARRTGDIRSAALEMAAENIRARGNT
jgi:hypothetical protein